MRLLTFLLSLALLAACGSDNPAVKLNMGDLAPKFQTVTVDGKNVDYFSGNVGKPLVIHTRSAADDTLRLMREEQAGEAGGVMHCFTERWEVAEAALEQALITRFGCLGRVTTPFLLRTPQRGGDGAQGR